MKHIEFSQGFFFLGDLQEYSRQQKLEALSNAQAPQADDIRNEELEFTYNLGDKFKIDIEGAKKRKEEREVREQESKKNFEELKKQMEESAKMTPTVEKSEKLQSSEVRQKPPVDEGEIEDEVGDSYAQDEDGIEDFYGDDTFKDGTMKNKIKAAGETAVEDGLENMDDEDLDLDYSQTHLDDFLKSQTSSSLLKGSNIQSGQLLNSFLSTYNKMKGSGTGLSSLQGTVDQANHLGQRKSSQPPEVIRENDEESIATEKKDPDEIDSDEELGRSEDEINLDNVSVKSSSSVKHPRPILKPEEVQKI